MKNIQPVTSWVNGQSVVATQLSVYSSFDDLATTAIFDYTLLSADLLTVSQGKLTIAGEDYQIWGSTVDVNQSAYEWVASQLNLTIDNTTTTTSTTSETTTSTTTETTTEAPVI
jgi:hypothetical protein